MTLCSFMLTFLLVKWQLWSSWSGLTALCMLYVHTLFVFNNIATKKRRKTDRFLTFRQNWIKPKNKQKNLPNKPINQTKKTKPTQNKPKPKPLKKEPKKQNLKETHSKPHQGKLIHYVRSSGVSKTDLAGQWLSDMTQIVEPVIKWFVLWQFSTGQF